MHTLNRLRRNPSALLIALGILLLVLPHRWIEVATDLDPDFGSGSLEFALAFGALAAGLLLRTVRRRRAGQSTAECRPES